MLKFVLQCERYSRWHIRQENLCSNEKDTHDGIFDKRAGAVKANGNLGHPHQLVVRLVKQHTKTFSILIILLQHNVVQTIYKNMVYQTAYYCCSKSIPMVYQTAYYCCLKMGYQTINKNMVYHCNALYQTMYCNMD